MLRRHLGMVFTRFSKCFGGFWGQVCLLLAPWPVLREHVLDVIERGTTARSHVLNLGHGVPPEADPEIITRVVSLAHGEAGDD